MSFSDRFGTVRNLTNIFEQSAGLGFVSLGQTLVILTGGIDLSIDGSSTIAAMLTSGLIDREPARVRARDRRVWQSAPDRALERSAHRGAAN